MRGRGGWLVVDLLQPTVEDLHRRGHSEITVMIERSGRVDSFAHKVLAETAAHMAGHDGQLTIPGAED